MTSADTNILFHAFHPGSPWHAPARAFLRRHAASRDFAVCELVLMEFYGLVRNPTVVERPLPAGEAAAVCQAYRRNRHWLVIDYPGGLMTQVWRTAAVPNFPRRKIYDVRLALTLRHHGVTEFATRNVRDFGGFGFDRVWDPLQD